MKKNLIACSLALLAGMQSLAQTTDYVDLRTGVLGNTYVPGGITTLLPNNAPDDTWEVGLLGSYPFSPTSYGPVYCGIGDPMGPYAPYANMPSTIKFLSPDMGPGGQHLESPGPGYYYYRMTFQRNSTCDVKSATFNFTHIGGDDVISGVYVNQTYYYPTNYSYVSFGPASFSIAPSSIVNGTNEIILVVYNWAEAPDNPLTPTGIGVDGNLTIVNGVDASFTLTTTTNSSVSATSTTTSTGTHYWEVYSSATGNAGTYTLVGTYTTPSFQFVGAGPCYRVKHIFTSPDCGTACAEQSVCYRECDSPEGNDCNLLTAPTGLTYNHQNHLMSWNPVPGAISYAVHITINDPACCPTAITDSRPKTFTVPSNSYQVNFLQAFNLDMEPSCFSWKVTAYCEDGSNITSDPICSYPAADAMANRMGPFTQNQDAGMDAKIYPNPAKGMVSIDIATKSETSCNVTITDAQGKTIQVFNNLKTAGNKYILQWNADKVSKGVYLVKIQTAGKETITRKCMVE